MFHFSPRNALLPSTAMTILLGLSACGGGGGSDPVPADTTINASGAAAGAGAVAGTVTTTTTPPPVSAPPPTPTAAFGLTDQRASATAGTVRLVGFNIATPNTLTSDVPITAATGAANAFTAGEWIYGMDFRPVDGVLWGLTNKGRLYTIDPTTGVATFKVALAADPADTTAAFTGLDSSTSISADFNPVVNRLRVVTFIGQNLSIDVDKGLVITDTDVAALASPPAAFPGFGWVAGVAYSNSFAGAQTTTTLYTINNSRRDLSTQTSPASGTQITVGSLGVSITEVQGFDIGGSKNELALGALRTTNAGPHSLYNINLTTGAAVLRPATTGTAEIGGPAGLPVVDIAIRR